MSTLRRFFSLLILLPLALAASPVTLVGPHIVGLRFVRPFRTSYMWQKPGAVAQAWIDLGTMPATLKRAVIAAEDANFYSHHGVDLREMKASWVKNQRKKRYARGFSTITMQLARNLYLTPHKNLVRKIFEVAIALEMEAVLPKDRILEIYLNVVEWGPGIYGAEEAAKYYFKKPASALSASETAFLVSILPNPKKWGHWPPGPYVAKRQAAILRRIGFTPAASRPPKKKPSETSETAVMALAETFPTTPSASIPSEMPESPEPIPELPENGTNGSAQDEEPLKAP